MSTGEAQATPVESEELLEWTWVALGTALGSLLIGAFVFLVDPHLERLDLAAYVVALSLVVVGIAVGRASRGETIRETAVVGVLLVILTGIVTAVFLDANVPTILWLMAPFYAAPLAMLGGWVGEMVQGTLEEAYEDRVVDWPWVIVSVVLGLAISTFSILLVANPLGLGQQQSLWIFAVSFLVTGWIVGFYSPGWTMVEPAIAAGLLTVVNASFVILWFRELPLMRVVLVGFGVGALLALLGGAAGEGTQWLVRRRQAKPEREKPSGS